MLQQSALEGVLRARGNRLLARDSAYFDRMFAALKGGPNRPMIVTDVELEKTGVESRRLWAALAAHYRLAGELGWISDELQPVSGSGSKPRLLYVPIEPAAEVVDPEGAGEAVAAATDADPPAP
jgi:hypothetical protein